MDSLGNWLALKAQLNSGQVAGLLMAGSEAESAPALSLGQRIVCCSGVLTVAADVPTTATVADGRGGNIIAGTVETKAA